MSWRQGLALGHPCWSIYRETLEALPGQAFPTPPGLTALLPPEAVNALGRPIRFVDSSSLDNAEYESRIYRSGEVSTRPRNMHDLFNALAWIHFPRTKSALNALHHEHREVGGSRGRVRDALTLFDEGGAFVLASDAAWLEAISRHDWSRVFCGDEMPWRTGLRVFLLGHGLLEKCLTPYKAMTANALLTRVPGEWMDMGDAQLASRIDEAAARLLLNGGVLSSPCRLGPLPLMGIPGWWHERQDGAFYADQSVFRPESDGRPRAPVHEAAVA